MIEFLSRHKLVAVFLAFVLVAAIGLLAYLGLFVVAAGALVVAAVAGALAFFLFKRSAS